MLNRASGTGALRSNVAGTMVLTGNNTYMDTTLVNTDTLVAAGNGTSGIGNAKVAACARLNLDAKVELVEMKGSASTLDSAADSTVNLLG